MCHPDPEWSRSLSTVLLGLRTNVFDVGSSRAEFVFGTIFRIPGELALPEDFSPNPHMFIEEFRVHMRKVKPIPITQKYKRKVLVFKELNSCSHVFLRHHAKKALERPYTGPHKVLSRVSDRVYEIDVDGIACHVSIEHIKPAHFAREDIDHLQPANDTSKPVLRTYSRKCLTFKQQ